MRKFIPYTLKAIVITMGLENIGIWLTHMARYRPKIKQMKLWVIKMKGRLRLNHRRCPRDSFLGVSARATFSGSEDFFARFIRMTGT